MLETPWIMMFHLCFVFFLFFLFFLWLPLVFPMDFMVFFFHRFHGGLELRGSEPPSGTGSGFTLRGGGRPLEMPLVLGDPKMVGL
jgi:hypothetical protein